MKSVAAILTVSLLLGSVAGCGGVLVTPTHVLTSVVCTLQVPATLVGVGQHYSCNNPPGDGEEIKVVNVITHPQFNQNLSSNDVAVLTLERPSTFHPVKLPALDGSNIKMDVWIRAMGWGLISPLPDGFASAELRRLDQQVITNKACQMDLDIAIQQSQVCAGGIMGQSPCMGDGGGPGIEENDPNRDDDDILLGLISAGDGCGVENSPAVYTRVSELLPWIYEQIR